MRVYPSILGADFGHLQDVVDEFNDVADGLHFDVMDGHFVPNLSFGVPILRSIKTTLPIDVHLMVTNPRERFREFVEAGASRIAFHVEVDEDIADNIAYLRDKGVSPGLAVDHDGSWELLLPYLDSIDYVIVMTVRAGFSGQVFIGEDLDKVRSIKLSHPNLEVVLDGGVTDETARVGAAAGADSVAATSYVIGHPDTVDRIQLLKSIS